MDITQIIRIKEYLAYIVIGGLPFYYFLRADISLSTYIYAGFLFLLFLISLYQNFKINIYKTNNSYRFLWLEIGIILNLIFAFIYLVGLERSLILMFVTLYITKSLFITTSTHNSFENVANVFVISSFFAGMGIIFGIFENLFADTNWFTSKMGFDYPYRNGMSETTHITGFLKSNNGSAYAIAAGLAFIKFQNIFKGLYKKSLYVILIVTLLATKAKFAFLIVASYIGFIVCSRLSKKWLLMYLSFLTVCYIFLSHIMVAVSGTYDYPSLHFREILFSIGTIDFILGNYGALKLNALEAILSNNFMPVGLDIFENHYGGRPHFMIGALIISGGISIVFLVLGYIYLVMKDSWCEVMIGLEEYHLYLCILFCFAIETINWNLTNNFYFWAIIFGLLSINKYKSAP